MNSDNPDTAGVMDERTLEAERMVEALLFACDRPLTLEDIGERLPFPVDLPPLLTSLTDHYAARGVRLVRSAGGYMFRTAEDLGFLLRREVEEERKLSRAGVETLAIIAYKQPVTRAEIEDIRGVSISKGTLDVLMEAGWVRMRGRRRTPGRPVTYGTTDEFLVHFGLDRVEDLPGLGELKAAGLLDSVAEAFDRLGTDADGDDGDQMQIDLEEAIAADVREQGVRRRTGTDAADSDAFEPDRETGAEAEPPDHTDGR